MNALQIVPRKPVVRVGRSVLLFHISGAILFLAFAGGMSISRGEDEFVLEPDAAVEIEDSPHKADSNDKSQSVTEPAAAPAAAATEGSHGSQDETGSLSAKPIAPSSASTPAGVKDDPKVGSEAGKPAAAEAKSNAAWGTTVDDRNTGDRNGGRALAKSPVRRVVQGRGKVDYRSRKSADRAPAWVSPPPVIYGPSPELMAPYAINAADAAKRQDRMSSSPARAVWRRVVEAPGAVLDGGKQALVGVLNSIW